MMKVAGTVECKVIVLVDAAFRTDPKPFGRVTNGMDFSPSAV